jgi:uncharacterized membrane protein
VISSIIKNQNLITIGSIDKSLLLRIIIFFSLSFWCIGFLLPIFYSVQNPVVFFFVKNIYASVCHQVNSKCITIGSGQMFVCARCAGIYFGGLTAVVLSLVLFTPFIGNRFLFLSVLPLLTDVFFTTIKIYNYSQILAFSTGILFGIVLSLVILSELENFFNQKLVKGYE